ncbi:predicted protein [Uncinocarpus reesii 1704]|uniref:DUF4246 domain-containing protein n=1 Tax=Uncinocarpus reesii (strain UAMH 1704) TaxID=336963 RepID=C4JYT3_UNCRE|nr:uncharacterized protein UREG_07334 [Uncinocarpus reesii 1704]EEP82469.1 predicted protein [Uncinocarpus reesii 1704]
MSLSRDPRLTGARLFPNALDSPASAKPYTMRELKLMQVFDSEITSKWRIEAMALDPDDITEAMMDWIIEELQFKAKLYKETGLTYVFDGDVVKSDLKIPKFLQESLKVAVAPLEDVPEEEKDYHPYSGDQVLNLVHPSLFPLVYGRTRIVQDGSFTPDEGVKRSGEGEVIEWPGYEQQVQGSTNSWSTKFQWLPCNISFVPTAPSGDQSAANFGSESFRCKINSYINNLHPDDHGDLYSILEEIITRTVPLWNMTLSGLGMRFNKRINYNDVKYDPDPDDIPEEQYPQPEENEPDYSYWARLETWKQEIRQVVLPEPGKFIPRPVSSKYTFLKDYGKAIRTLEQDQEVDLYESFKASGLQVIVKLANIYLTPEDPDYTGGLWHVEGQLNERICATALYYYDSENITDSRLSFRQSISEDFSLEIGYEQFHFEWQEKVFGLEEEALAVQELGSVSCKEGRLLTFPNIFQHRVEPFHLKDPTKPGHRKIVALFLVDPNVRITSTAEVPAQRKDWWLRQVPLDNILTRLPQELGDQVQRELSGFPMTMEEAQELRLELMDERVAYADDDEWPDTFIYSLCEH